VERSPGAEGSIRSPKFLHHCWKKRKLVHFWINRKRYDNRCGWWLGEYHEEAESAA